MKKIIVIVLALALSVSLVACTTGAKGGKDDNADVNTTVENVQVVSPVSELTVSECAEALGLKNIAISSGSITSSVKIDGEPVIYSFDAVVGEVTYTVRIAKAAAESDNTDISGVYFSGALENAIFDSADVAEAPSANVASDGDYAVASCNWNGYLMSVSAEKLSVEEIHNALLVFTPVIACDNIVAE